MRFCLVFILFFYISTVTLAQVVCYQSPPDSSICVGIDYNWWTENPETMDASIRGEVENLIRFNDVYPRTYSDECMEAFAKLLCANGFEECIRQGLIQSCQYLCDSYVAKCNIQTYDCSIYPLSSCNNGSSVDISRANVLGSGANYGGISMYLVAAICSLMLTNVFI